MRTGNGNTLSVAHQFRQHRCARNYRNALRACCGHFDVVRRYGGGNHHEIASRDMRRRVTLEHRSTPILQPTGYAGQGDVRSADGVAELKQDGGDGTHAHAADANEMNVTRFT